MEQPENRAKVYNVKLNELEKIFPDINFKTDEKYDILNYYLKKVENYVRNGGINLRRGDIVSLEGFNEDEGKVIFDGLSLINVEEDGNDHFIPQSFQVITEFPPYYWKGIFKWDMVFYDLGTHFQNIYPDQIKRIGNIYYFQITHNNKVYKIIGDIDKDTNFSEEAFINILLDAAELFNLLPFNEMPQELQPNPFHLYLRIGKDSILNEPWDEKEYGITSNKMA
jgi:hypothetical protein